VGVGLGAFSEFLLAELRPTRCVAIDAFGLHESPEVWGNSSASTFGDRSHIQYYAERLAAYKDSLVIEQGLSWEVLARYPDESFDLIYIDAAHDFESVRRDADIAVQKVRSEGILVFNDYTLVDPVNGESYGVVQVVNDLVVRHGWHVVAFALQRHLFCDIAIRRTAPLRGGAD